LSYRSCANPAASSNDGLAVFYTSGEPDGSDPFSAGMRTGRLDLLARPIQGSPSSIAFPSPVIPHRNYLSTTSSGGCYMRVVIADIKGRGGFVNKDTVVEGYVSRLRGFSWTTRW